MPLDALLLWFSKRPDPPRLSHDGSGLAIGAGRKGRHDQLTNVALAAWFGAF
jgi:hypothetical protein